MLLVLVLFWLPPKDLLQPSRSTSLWVGLAGGFVSVAAFEALQWNAPELRVVAYPTATAFIALFFGGPAAIVAALFAFAAVLRTGASAAVPAIAVLGVAIALGLMWRIGGERKRIPDWVRLAGLTLTLPLAVAGCLWAIDSTTDVVLPWHHGAGCSCWGWAGSF